MKTLELTEFRNIFKILRIKVSYLIRIKTKVLVIGENVLVTPAGSVRGDDLLTAAGLHQLHRHVVSADPLASFISFSPHFCDFLSCF